MLQNILGLFLHFKKKKLIKTSYTLKKLEKTYIGQKSTGPYFCIRIKESCSSLLGFTYIHFFFFFLGGGGLLRPPGTLHLHSARYLRHSEHRLRFPDNRSTSIPMPVCKQRFASVAVFLCFVCEIYVCSKFLCLLETKPCIKSKN